MLVYDDGLRRMTVRYIQERPDGFYYRRRIPRDLQKHFGGKTHHVVSLHTKSKRETVKRIVVLAAQDDAYWALLRDPASDASKLPPAELTKAALGTLQHLEITPGATGREAEWNDIQLEGYLGKYDEAREADRDPYIGEHPPVTDYLNALDHELIRLVNGGPTPKRLSDALEIYLSEHPRGRQTRFAREITNAIDLAKACVGDLPLTAYKQEHARTVRDVIVARGVTTSTVRRQIERVSAVHTKGLRAFDLPMDRFPFRGVTIINEGTDSKRRQPLTLPELEVIADAVRKADDDKRHILGFQVNTGARLAEIVGLKVSDVVLTGPVPHVIIRSYVERPLKTKGSARHIPLVGVSLWSAQRALETTPSRSSWLFPRYMGDATHKAGSASATLNKWLKALLNGEKTTHSFRHAFRDRLRDVHAPFELVEMLGGWSLKTVGQGYGQGYSLEVSHSWLEKIAI